eukprot:796968-Rhodomonas_salina.2
MPYVYAIAEPVLTARVPGTGTRLSAPHLGLGQGGHSPTRQGLFSGGFQRFVFASLRRHSIYQRVCIIFSPSPGTADAGYGAAGTEVAYGATELPGTDAGYSATRQGHIRFWKMADTFTGLKLQVRYLLRACYEMPGTDGPICSARATACRGEIGKFGAIELSDISAYLELNDGKVLSG